MLRCSYAHVSRTTITSTNRHFKYRQKISLFVTAENFEQLESLHRYNEISLSVDFKILLYLQCVYYYFRFASNFWTFRNAFNCYG